MKKLITFFATFFMFSAFGIDQISVNDLKTVVNSGDNDFVLLDVRTPSEYNAGHIKGAALVPLQGINTQIDNIVEKYGKKKIYLICRSGRRSSIAYGILNKFDLNVYNVAGGMNAWNSLSL